AAARGVADMDRMAQIQRFDERGDIVGVRVHVVAVPRLARATVAAAVGGDAAVSAGAQKQHLVFPGVGAQRPAMAEDHGLSATPVLVIDLRAVLGRDRAHGVLSLSCSSMPRAAERLRNLADERDELGNARKASNPARMPPGRAYASENCYAST